MTKTCINCNKDISDRGNRSIRCIECQKQRERELKNKRRKNLSFGIIFDKKGNPIGYKSKRGSQLRRDHWKAIVQYDNTPDIESHYSKFKKEYKEAKYQYPPDKNGKRPQAYYDLLWELDTIMEAIKAWWNYIRNFELRDGRYLTGKVTQGYDMPEDDENTAYNRPNEIEKDFNTPPHNIVIRRNTKDEEPKPTLKPNIESVRKTDSGVSGYTHKFEGVIGEVTRDTYDKDKTPWFHKQVQPRIQDILDIELKNRRELLKSRPYLRKKYWKWDYAKNKY